MKIPCRLACSSTSSTVQTGVLSSSTSMCACVCVCVCVCVWVCVCQCICLLFMFVCACVHPAPQGAEAVQGGHLSAAVVRPVERASWHLN
jgi:hypothetical protein